MRNVGLPFADAVVGAVLDVVAAAVGRVVVGRRPLSHNHHVRQDELFGLVYKYLVVFRRLSRGGGRLVLWKALKKSKYLM